MTIRTPNDKTAVQLVKNAFEAAGAKVRHTQALDLVAQLQGFRSWAHKQSAQRTMLAQTPQGMTFELLVQQLAEVPSQGVQARLDDWKYQTNNGDTFRGFADWCASELESDTGVSLHGLKFDVPSCPVTLPDGSPAHWSLEQNLSDRWGELNTALPATKPSLVALMLDATLLESLQVLMAGEDTFIAAKDGNLGLLFELEYYCAESEVGEDSSETAYRSYEQQKATLLNGLNRLQPQYPAVEFAVPDASQTFNGRPAVWGFVSLADAQAMAPDAREELARAMDNL